MCKNEAEVFDEEEEANGDAGKRPKRNDTTSSFKSFGRSRSIVIRRLPLQEAIKNRNSMKDPIPKISKLN